MRTNGQIGYDAYRAKTGGVSIVTGQAIPEWKELRTEIKEAWEAAGEAIEDGSLERGMQVMVRDATRTEPDYQVCMGRISPQVLRLLHASMGLSTEVGEFTDALKKHIFYGKPLDLVNCVEELGDLTWYERIACDQLEVSYLQILERNIAKLKARFPGKFTEGHANHRDLGKERAILEGGAA